MDARWQEETAAILSGFKEWRQRHPTATLSEIEEALDERLNRVRARVLADLALASAAADVSAASPEERPRCERCGAVLHARGPSERTLRTQGGAEVRLRRAYATCPTCGDGAFPPGR